MNLRYLHLSDLHFVGQGACGSISSPDRVEHDMVSASMLEAIEELVSRGLSLHCIFITGDLAARGKDEDYQCAETFCNRLLEVTRVSRSRLYMVPGNHDVDRSEVHESHIRWWYRFDQQSDIAQVLSSSDVVPVLMRKLHAYNEFAERMTGRPVSDGSAYYVAESVALAEGGDRSLINLVGLNSALFAGYDNDDRGQLALGMLQVEGALRRVDKSASLTIVFFHHPPQCFHHEDRVSVNILMREADLILTGHLHEPTSAFVRSGAGQATIVSAGASFKTRDSENSFNLVEVDLDTGDGLLQFFKYLPTQHRWVINRDANPNDEKGVFTFEIEKITGSRPRFVDGEPELAYGARRPGEPDSRFQVDLLEMAERELLYEGRALHYEQIAALTRRRYPMAAQTADLPRKIYGRLMREIGKSARAHTRPRFRRVAPGVFMVAPEQIVIPLNGGAADPDVYRRIPPTGQRFIPLGARIAVPDGWTAALGSYGSTLATFGAGVHVLGWSEGQLQSMPHLILDDYGVAVYAFISCVRTGTFQFPWGTPQPITMPDRSLSVVTIRAFGYATLRISNPAMFESQAAGTDAYRLANSIRGIVVGAFAALVSQDYTSIEDLPYLYRDAGRLPELAMPSASRFGIDVIDIRLESVSFGEDTEKRIAAGK